MTTDRIYHITTRRAWDAAQQHGKYEAPSLHSQGFIHLSKADQVLRVANAIYADQSDLVLLEVDPVRLKSELRYEPPDMTLPAEHQDDELFPHLYGALNLDAVAQVCDFPSRADGTFELPAGIGAG